MAGGPRLRLRAWLAAAAALGPLTAWACSQDSDCQSGSCLRGYFWNQCAQMSGTVAGGGSCSRDSECASGVCLDSPLAVIGVTSLLRTCQYPKGSNAPGQDCKKSAECRSGVCIDGWLRDYCSEMNGTVADGKTCHIDSECASGTCLSKQGACAISPGTLAAGTKCSTDSECASKMCSLSFSAGNKCLHAPASAAVGTWCRKDIECSLQDGVAPKDLKVCQFERFWYIEGVCAKYAMQNDTNGVARDSFRCTAHNQCVSTRCIFPLGGYFSWGIEGYCSKVDGSVAAGGTCSVDEECSTGTCVFKLLTGVCQQPAKSLAGGASCLVNSECISGRCKEAFIGRSRECASAGLAKGAKCTLDEECASNFCASGLCAVPGVLADGVSCGYHKACKSQYCVGMMRLGLGTCAPSTTNLPPDAGCYVDASCQGGHCIARWYREMGYCSKLNGSVAAGQPCEADSECVTQHCVLDSMAFIAGQVCVAPYKSLPQGAACRVDSECATDFCDGKFFRNGTCHQWRMTSHLDFDTWTSPKSMPPGQLVLNTVAIRKFVADWKKNIAPWENLGVVDVRLPGGTIQRIDLLSDTFELYMYERVITVVMTLFAESLQAVKMQAFSQDLQVAAEGATTIPELDTLTQTSTDTRQLFAGAADTMAWAEAFMKGERWFEPGFGSVSLPWGGKVTVMPETVVRNFTRQALCMSVAFLQKVVQGGDARVMGRWFLFDVFNSTGSRRLLEDDDGSTTAEMKQQSEQDINVVKQTIDGVNDTWVNGFVDGWYNKYQGEADIGQVQVLGFKFDVFPSDMEKAMYKKLVSAFAVSIHEAVSVHMELPFLFGEKMRLQRVNSEQEKQKQGYVANSTLGDQVQASLSNPSPTKKRRLAEARGLQEKLWDSAEIRRLETSIDGYGATDQYMVMQVDQSSLTSFIDVWHKVYLNSTTSDRANFGAFTVCDPFGCLPANSSCAFVDLIDDKLIVERFAKISLTFLSSAMMTSELRVFGQRLFGSLRSAQTERRVSAYLRLEEHHTPFEDVDYWVSMRFRDDIVNLQDMWKNICSTALGDQYIRIFPDDSFRQLLVRGVAFVMSFLEMAMLDTRLEIFGRHYELKLSAPDANTGRRLRERALQTAYKVDWAFVDKFIEGWYDQEGAEDLGLPPVTIDLQPLFKFRVELLPEWEKFVYKVALGMTLDLVNTQLEDAHIPLPLPLVEKALVLKPVGSTGGKVPLAVPPADQVIVSVCLRGSEWFRCALPQINGNLSKALSALDPIPTVASDPKAVELHIDAINANGRCGYSAQDLRGLSTLQITDLQVEADFQCGLSDKCRVCTQDHKACGDLCIPRSSTCSSPPSCAVDAVNASADVVLTGWALKSGNGGNLTAYCRLCLQGRACGDGCTTSATAVCPSGCAASPSEVVCKVCTGNRTKCGDDCIDAGAACTPRSGCARNANEVSDIDLQRVGGASGKIAIAATQISIVAQGRCDADFCGTSVPEGSCCANEEKYLGLCYQTCNVSTAGAYPKRFAACTCAKNTRCDSDEEEFLGLCYKKCSILTGGTHPVRTAPNTCTRATRCQDDEEEYLGLCYKKCSLLTGGSYPDRWMTNTCAQATRCTSNEEEFLGLCYRKCSILTNGTYPSRFASNTCQRATVCADNEELYLGLCYKKCSLLTNGERPWRSATNTCSRNTWCKPDEESFLGLCYKNCSLLTNGAYPYRVASNTCCSGNCWNIFNWWTSGLGCNGFGVSSGGGCATLPYDPWTNGLGCNGFGISGSGCCAKLPYDPWTSGLGCNGFGVGGDGGCAKVVYHPWTNGLGCNGFGVSSGGGCATLPYDPWTQGLGCNGFGVAADGGCAKIPYHPWTDCLKFGTAANGGLAHLPNLPPLTLTAQATVKKFRAAAGFAAAIDLAQLQLSSLTVSNLQVSWDEISIAMPALGVFSPLLQGITGAISQGIARQFSSAVNTQLEQLLNDKLAREYVPLINSKINYTKIINAYTAGLASAARRLETRSEGQQLQIHPGVQYVLLPDGTLHLPEPGPGCANPHFYPQRLLGDSDVSVAGVVASAVSPYAMYQTPGGVFLTPVENQTDVQAQIATATAWGADANVTIWSYISAYLTLRGLLYGPLRRDVVRYNRFVDGAKVAIANLARVDPDYVVVMPVALSEDTIRMEVGLQVPSGVQALTVRLVSAGLGGVLEEAVASTLQALKLTRDIAYDTVVVSAEKIDTSGPTVILPGAGAVWSGTGIVTRTATTTTTTETTTAATPERTTTPSIFVSASPRPLPRGAALALAAAAATAATARFLR